MAAQSNTNRPGDQPSARHASGSSRTPSETVPQNAASPSPPAQTARNRCHRLERVGAGGQGALRHGVLTGGACIAACWAWMVVPLTVATGHSLIMLAVAFYLFAERLAPAGTLRWRLPPGLVILGGLRMPMRHRQPMQTFDAHSFR